MQQTSVRFGDETYDTLKARCERDGVPIAQYIREATIARMAVDAERTRQAVSDMRFSRELAELRARVERVEQRQRR